MTGFRKIIFTFEKGQIIAYKNIGMSLHRIADNTKLSKNDIRIQLHMSLQNMHRCQKIFQNDPEVPLIA